MDKLSKAILKEMRFGDEEKPVICSLPGSFSYRGTFTVDDLAKKVHATRENTLSAIRFLCEKGLIKSVPLPSTKTDATFGYMLTHEGRKHNILRAEKAVLNIFNSIIIPIAVSFITSVITDLVQGWL